MRPKALDLYDWMTVGGMHQCVPPAYSAYLGAQILDHLAMERAA